MALSIALNAEQTNQGIDAPACYCRIVALHYDLLANRVDVSVNGYISQEAREAGKSPVWGGVFGGFPGGIHADGSALMEGEVAMPSLDGSIPGVRAALYTWLKSLPEFADALDV